MSAFAQWWNKSFKTPQGQGLLLLIIISLICCAGFCIFGARFFYIKGDETMKKQKKEEAEAGKGTSRIQPSKEGKLSSMDEMYIDE